MAIWGFLWGHFGVKFGQFYDNLEAEKRSAKKGDSNGDLGVSRGHFGAKFGQLYDNLEVEKRSAKKGDFNGDLVI